MSKDAQTTIRFSDEKEDASIITSDPVIMHTIEDILGIKAKRNTDIFKEYLVPKYWIVIG